MTRPKIHLIDVTGFDLPGAGTSADWFASAFDALDLHQEAELVVHDGIGLPLPGAAGCAEEGSAVIISGSHGPVWMDRAWIPPLMDFIREVHSRGGWLLGVCFGHQALALALGGEVSENPRGREMGTVQIFLTNEGAESPLFEGFKSGDPVNIVHRTHVSRMPDGAVRLAFNQMTPTQAFSKGNSFGFQPHPELTPPLMRRLADMYGKILVEKERFLDDEEHLENFRSSFLETPSSMRILRNFTKLVSSGGTA